VTQERKKLGPFSEGMNNMSKETEIPEGQCRRGQNIDFHKGGAFSRRQGRTLLLSAVNVHSLYAGKAHDTVFAGQGNTLGIFDVLDSSYTPKISIPSAVATDFTELNGTVYASNYNFHCKFARGSIDASDLGAPLPALTPTVEAVANGGLEAGTYTVAYSVLDENGEESPLSEEFQVTVQQGGGIAIMGMPIVADWTIRIYSSGIDGEELYQVVEAPMNSVSFLFGITELRAGGRQPETRFMCELPYGHFIEAFDNRLIVASGKSVFWSPAFRPHLCDIRHNFVTLESIITMVKPVDGGVFVSDQNRVIFLDNTNPDDFTVVEKDAEPAIFGSAVNVPGAAIGEEYTAVDSAIIWLSKYGHLAGLPNGQIIRMNADQLNLQSYIVASSVFTERNGVKQVIIPVNSDQRDGTGTAVDSSI